MAGTRSENGVSKLLPYVGVLVLFFGAASSSGVALWRIDAQAEEIKDLGQSVDENEDAIELIQRRLIERQGQVELDVQSIKIEQRQLKEGQDRTNQLLEQLLQQRRE